MKKLFLAVFFIIGATFTYASPFGLKMGMTIDEIAEQCEDEPSFVKDDVYLVPKHLFAEGTNYSSVNGRSKKIRNTQASFNIENQNIIYNKDKTVLILNDEPYLTKVTDKKTFEDLMQIIKEANARRKPDPEPIFPVKLPTFPGENN